MSSDNNTYGRFIVIIVACALMVASCALLLNRQVPQAPDKILTLSGGMFDLDVTVIITKDTAIALQYVQEHLDSSATLGDFNSRATTFPTKDGKPPIIWLPETEDVAIINHELMHASIDMMSWAGIKLCDETEEVYAYEMQYLTMLFYEELNK